MYVNVLISKEERRTDYNTRLVYNNGEASDSSTTSLHLRIQLNTHICKHNRYCRSQAHELDMEGSVT